MMILNHIPDLARPQSYCICGSRKDFLTHSESPKSHIPEARLLPVSEILVRHTAASAPMDLFDVSDEAIF